MMIMSRYATFFGVAFWVVMTAGRIDAKLSARAALGAPFVVRNGETVRLGELEVKLIAEHRPMERDAAGRELFPFTNYSLFWKEGADEAKQSHVAVAAKGQAQLPQRLFGRYTFVVERGADDNQVRITVAKRSCRMEYTHSNQLKHADGQIIFTENEDLCCWWSDGEDRCDREVTRADRAGSTPRYCVIYSLKRNSPDDNCCCKFERGEKLSPACEAECAPPSKPTR